jgi:uncharacterized lipoprotein NlpE involved in copper resistance
MKKLSGLLLAGTLLFAACNEKNADTASVDSSVPSKDSPATAAPDMHNAANSLDIEGTYSGLLPCASCEGIETTLVLNADKTFSLTEHYKGEKEPMTAASKGNWVVTENTMTLQFSKELQDRIVQYKVEENRLRMLDQKGQVITGALAENYILNKK